jgi:hypothetical protein
MLGPQALWPAVAALQARLPHDAAFTLDFLQSVYDIRTAPQVRGPAVREGGENARDPRTDRGTPGNSVNCRRAAGCWTVGVVICFWYRYCWFNG